MSSVLKIEDDLIYTKIFSFCTLVTRLDEYMEMVESAQRAGFDGEDVEFLYFDNREINKYDGYSAINRAIKEAKGKYLIFCHQDVLFKHDKRKDLEQKILDLSLLDPKWALAGNAGINHKGQMVLRISDPNGNFQKKGQTPSTVLSLDENFIIFNQSINNSCSYGLTGFHLYGIDLCHHAEQLGLSSYVIDFNLYHKSAGNKDRQFNICRKASIDFYGHQKKRIVFWTVCTIFFSTSFSFINKILNSKLSKKLFLMLKRN